jgi:hypothetical protein
LAADPRITSNRFRFHSVLESRRESELGIENKIRIAMGIAMVQSVTRILCHHTHRDGVYMRRAQSTLKAVGLHFSLW